MTIIDFIDYAKLSVSALAALVFLIAFVAPLYGTIYPYWKENGRPSGIMLGRVGTRFFLFLLAVHEAAFPLNRLLGYPLSRTFISVLVIPVLMILSILVMYSWVKHPQGMGGL